MAKITAVIDIGSNSARMAVFQKTSRFGFNLIKEVKSRVRVSEDTYQNSGYLQPRPMQRAISALREFKSIAQGLKARKILCVATSALRDAPNGSELVKKVRDEVGLNIKVIDGEKEAFYGAVAALNLLPLQSGFTIDIGGGSTECAHIVDGRIVELYSLDIGTIRLKELFFDRKRPVAEAMAFIEKEFAKLPETIKSDTVIGIGGTIRALSKSIIKKSDYPIDQLHGFEYDVNGHLKVFEKIAASHVLKLGKFGIKEERFDTIRGGALIFCELLKRFNAERVVTSGVGVREGVFLSDLLRNCNNVFPKNLNPSVRSLLDRFCNYEREGGYKAKIALSLFDALAPLHEMSVDYRYHLNIAARLANIGVALNYYDHHKHGSYFLLNSLRYGFTHTDKAVIALLLEYNNKKIPKSSAIEGLEKLMPNLLELQWLSFILTLAESITLNMDTQEVRMHYSEQALYIRSERELYLAKESVKKLNKPKPMAIIFEHQK